MDYILRETSLLVNKSYIQNIPFKSLQHKRCLCFIENAEKLFKKTGKLSSKMYNKDFTHACLQDEKSSGTQRCTLRYKAVG